MKQIQEHLAQILAIITALIEAGHLAHLFNLEWVVLLFTILTAIATFVPGQGLAARAPPQAVK